MINLSVRLTDPSLACAAASSKNTAPAAGSQSFASQLSEALAEALTKMGIDPSSVQLTVNHSTGQANVTRQNSAGTSAAPAPAGNYDCERYQSGRRLLGGAACGRAAVAQYHGRERESRAGDAAGFGRLHHRLSDHGGGLGSPDRDANQARGWVHLGSLGATVSRAGCAGAKFSRPAVL